MPFETKKFQATLNRDIGKHIHSQESRSLQQLKRHGLQALSTQASQVRQMKLNAKVAVHQQPTNVMIQKNLKA